MSAPLVTIQNLDVSYRRANLSPVADKGRHVAVSNVSLTVERGECLAIVGESGSGKSSLARAIVGLAPISGGAIAFNGEALPPKDSARRMQWRSGASMMFQDAGASLNPRLRVKEILLEPHRIHRRTITPQTAQDLASRVGLPQEILRRFPGELSGGQAKRVALARAIALGPALLIADEPTAGLDPSVQGGILNLLTQLRTMEGVTLLVVSHDMAVVRHLADRVGVMHEGRLVELEPTQALIDRPNHPHTKSLLSAADGAAAAAQFISRGASTPSQRSNLLARIARRASLLFAPNPALSQR